MIDNKRIQNRIFISIILGLTLIFITASLVIGKQQNEVNRVFMEREVKQEEMELKNKLVALAEIHIVESENNDFKKYLISDLDKNSNDYKTQSNQVIGDLNKYSERSKYINDISILNLNGEIIESTLKSNIGSSIGEEFLYTLNESINNKYSYEFDIKKDEFFIISPILSEVNGDCLGYYKKDINLNYLKKILSKHNVEGKERSFLILKDGTIISDKDGIVDYSKKIKEEDKYKELNTTKDNVFVTYIDNQGEVTKAVSNYVEGLNINIVYNLCKSDFNRYTMESILRIFIMCLVVAIFLIYFTKKIIKIIVYDLKGIKKMLKEYEINGYIRGADNELSLMGREVYKIIREFEKERETYNYNLENINQLFIERDILTDEIVINRKLWIEFFGFCPKIDYINIVSMFINNIDEIDKDIYAQRVREAKAGKKESLITEFKLRDKTGNYKWVRENKVFIRNKEGKVIKEISNIKDIDLEKHNELLMKKRAEIDGLTGFYNKEFAKFYIEKYIESGALGGIFILFDLDNFKYINDNLGHQFGDEVLRQVSEKVKGVFRESDIFGRIGGDEFIVFLKGNKVKDSINKKCEKLVEVLNSEIKKDNIIYRVSGSIGVAKYMEDADSYEGLYEKADTAMYYAKESGKNSFALYNNKIKTKAQRETDILNLIEELSLSSESNIEKYIRCSPVRNRITQEIVSYIFFFDDCKFNDEAYTIDDLKLIAQKYKLVEKVYTLIIDGVLKVIKNTQVNTQLNENLEVSFLFEELDPNKFIKILARSTKKYNLDTNSVKIFLNLEYINNIGEEGRELEEKIKELGYKFGIINIRNDEYIYVNLNIDYVDEILKVSENMYKSMKTNQREILLKHLINFYNENNTMLRLANLSYDESLKIDELNFNYYDSTDNLTYNDLMSNYKNS
ncbi:diguanylate cyclase domain-containing protein [Clostridium sp.]|uniref:sensor domain-containing diguanylate cyclase n=1 Tax=Clostridium sp. TaxID=1506 RepID=UPI003F3F7212